MWPSTSPTLRVAAIITILAASIVLFPIPLPIVIPVLAALGGAAAMDARAARRVRVHALRNAPATIVRGVPATMSVRVLPGPLPATVDPKIVDPNVVDPNMATPNVVDPNVQSGATTMSDTADTRSTAALGMASSNTTPQMPARAAISALSHILSRIRQPLPAELSTTAPDWCRIKPDAQGNIVASHRGIFALPPLSIRVRGPIGIVHHDHEAGGTHYIKVIPDLPGARSRAVTLKRGRMRVEEGMSRGRMGLGTELESVREWVPEDDIRRVNWAATARTGHYMTNQYRIEENRNVICLVDAGRLMASPIGDATRLDINLDAVCAVAAVADAGGDRVGAVAFSSDVIRIVSPRRSGARAVVNALYDIQPRDEESNFSLAFRRIATEKRSILVILTDLLDESAAWSLLSSIPVLAKRHALLVASVSDPSVNQAICSVPERSYDAYRSVVALDVTAERNRVVSLLRRKGVIVVEAPPGSFNAACVAGYLDIKRKAQA